MISVLASDAMRPNAAHTTTITPTIFLSCSTYYRILKAYFLSRPRLALNCSNNYSSSNQHGLPWLLPARGDLLKFTRVVYRCAAPIQYISAAERSEAAEPKTPPRLVRGLAGGAAGGKKNHAIWLHFPSKSGNNIIDYRIVE